MDNDVIKEARKRVGVMLGEALADKATAAFCLAFARPTTAVAGLEAMGAAAPPQAVVVEFSDKPQLTTDVSEAVEKIRGTEAWGKVRDALSQIQLPASEIFPVTAARLLRSVKVTSVRDDFFKVSGHVRDEIERSARGFFRPGPETTASTQMASAVTEICWLNRTVRTWVPPRSLAEIVADPAIQQVDLPRRLMPDINVSARTVGAPQFRKKFNVSGKGIIVAVIDTEVAPSHPALTSRVVHKQNFSKEPWGNPASHGTAVAGIIASNDAKFGGMAPDATIYNYKVLATNSFLNGDDFDGALGIQQAVEDGVHIANCSWGAGAAGDGTSREAKACDAAWTLGLAIVKSAGNRGPGSATLTTPADADGVIAVGATDRAGMAVQDYSSRGPANAKQRPHLVAPGGADGAGITSCLVGGGFGDCGSGTSFAAPHVSGLLALLLERDANLTPDQLRAALLSECTPIAGLDVNTQGAGLVSLAGLVT